MKTLFLAASLFVCVSSASALVSPWNFLNMADDPWEIQAVEEVVEEIPAVVVSGSFNA
jgi:hypothetical protein